MKKRNRKEKKNRNNLLNKHSISVNSLRDAVIIYPTQKHKTQHFVIMKSVAPKRMPSVLKCCVVQLLLLLSIVACTQQSSSSSDVLMIRHGRSRVRHSTEKNHIRWGLKAFDNLTLMDYDYDSPNGTNGTYDAPYDIYMVGNQSTLESSPPLTPSNTVEWRTSSTPPPPPWARWTSTSASMSPSVPRKKLAKKQIMESIRKDVNAGVEYLRTHAHLSAPTVSMPQLRTMLRPVVVSQPPASKKASPFNEEESMQADDSGAAASSAIHTVAHDHQSPLSLDANRSEITDKHNLNGNDRKTNQPPTNSHKIPSTKRNGSVDDGAAAAAPTNDDSESNKNLNHPVSDQKTIALHQMHSDGGHNDDYVVGHLHMQDGNDEEQQLMNDDGRVNETRRDGELPFSPSGLYSSAEANDEANAGNGVIEEQTINFESNDDMGDTVPNQHQIDYIDLEDLDDISRDNRLKMKKGSDVLTRFLEIVESQHLLGANCTAGTALNLGEGVVDQYAQDRFRTTAEVAVNRANMLTR